jgi:hypothetical protein
MTNFLDPAPPDQEWANCSISQRAVAYSCGAIGRRGDVIEHDHDPEELARCRRLSAEAAKVMEGVVVGMGSSGLDDYFAPFYVAACRGAKAPRKLDEEMIRRAFGGTIYPGVEILVEPLEERGEWWALVREYLVDNDDALEDEELLEEGEEELARWREMVRWFRDAKELHGASFVMMRAADWPRLDWICCDFPYLALGITQAGSLVGIWGRYVDR